MGREKARIISGCQQIYDHRLIYAKAYENWCQWRDTDLMGCDTAQVRTKPVMSQRSIIGTLQLWTSDYVFFGNFTWNVPVTISISHCQQRRKVKYNKHCGNDVISGTTVPCRPNLDSAPLIIPAGMATYYEDRVRHKLTSEGWKRKHQFGSLKGIRSAIPRGDARYWFE